MLRDEIDITERWLKVQRRTVKAHFHRVLMSTVAFGLIALLLTLGALAATLQPLDTQSPADLTGISLVTYDFADCCGSNLSFFLLNQDAVVHSYSIHYNMTLSGISGLEFSAQTYWRGNNWQMGVPQTDGCPCQFAQVLDGYSLGLNESYIEWHTQTLWIDGGQSQAWYLAVFLSVFPIRDFPRQAWTLTVWTVL